MGEIIEEINLIFNRAIKEKNYALALKAKEIILRYEKSKIVLTKGNLKNLIKVIDDELKNIKILQVIK